jgi:hypothetical protein
MPAGSDNCHENGGSVHEKSMTDERSLFSSCVMRRMPMTPVEISRGFQGTAPDAEPF